MGGGAHLLPVVVLLALATTARGWISISQSHFGAQPKDIAQSMHGVMPAGASAQSLLGYIWSMPADPLSDRGLGGGIAYAWDPELCAKLAPLFREDFIVFNFVGCADFKAALFRAFDTWAAHHKLISFHDVTSACIDLGHGTSSASMRACPLHEVYVTSIDTTSRGMAATGEEAATSIPTQRLTTDFRFTNGATPFSILEGTDGTAQGASSSPPRQVPRAMIETYKGEIQISTNICWYLDSYFCAGFHSLKHASSPRAVHLSFTALIFTLWALALIAVALHLVASLVRQLQLRAGGEGDLDKEGKISYSERAYACVDLLAKQSVLGTAARLVLIFIPFPFYQALFITCWDCFDFEAALTHEVGHLLGLGHPDLAGLELRSGFGTTAANVYTAAFATPSDGPSSRYPNASSSLSLWDSVTAGLPPGAAINSATGQRQSLMDSFTAHNPHVCLTADDLEGLNTLYPVASGAVVDPRCFKSPLYIGFLRMVVYVVGPFTLALVLSILLHACTHSADEQKYKEVKKDLVQAKVAMKMLQTRESARVLRASLATTSRGAGAPAHASTQGQAPSAHPSARPSAHPSAGPLAPPASSGGGVEMYETVM